MPAAKYRHLHPQIRAAAAAGEAPIETAQRLGIGKVQLWRERAALGLTRERTLYPGKELADLPHCPICGLRGEHECLRGDAAARSAGLGGVLRYPSGSRTQGAVS